MTTPTPEEWEEVLEAIGHARNVVAAIPEELPGEAEGLISESLNGLRMAENAWLKEKPI